MSGEITALPRKGRNRWMVYVPPIMMPDGTKTKGDRKVVTAGSKSEALRWGQERRGVLIEEHRRRRAGELEAARPMAPTFAEFSKVWLERLRVQAAKGEKKRSSVEATGGRRHARPVARTGRRAGNATSQAGTRLRVTILIED